MNDEEIITRFWRRDESAIEQLDRQHGALVRALARRILKSREDAEECVSDTYLRLWERIPPDRPASLPAYLARIVRNLAFDRLREQGSQKRGGAAVTVALEELSQVTGGDNVEDAVAARELGRAVERFLRSQPPLACDIFLRRYFYFEDRAEIAARCGISPAQVSVRLSRTRKKLAQFLKEEGYL